MADPVEDVVDMQDDDGGQMLPDHLLSKANRRLKQQIRDIEASTQKTQTEVGEHKSRVQFMSGHLQNVKAEIASSQAVIDAKRREVESEQHFASMADRVVSRFKQDVSRYAKERDQLMERLESIQNLIFEGNLKIDEFKQAMAFNQDELEQWDLTRKQREEDNAALERYKKTDDGRIRDLSLQIERLEANLTAARKQLHTEVTDTQAAQIELNKTAEDFTRLQTEREDLVKRLEDTVEAIKRRNEAIEAAAQRYGDGSEWVAKRKDVLAQHTAFLDVEKQNNKDVEAKIAAEDRGLVRLRDQVQQAQASLRALEDEVTTLQGEVSKALQDLNTRKSEHAAVLQQLEEKKKAHAKAVAANEAALKKLENEASLASDMHAQHKMVQDLQTDAEMKQKELNREVALLKEQQYAAGNELAAARKEEATLTANIMGAKAQARQVVARVAQLDHEAFRQQELLYNIQYQVQVMERTVARAKGERSRDERAELQAKIQRLTATLEEVQKQRWLLDGQLKKVQEDLRHARNATDKAKSAKEHEGERILEVTLANETLSGELAKLTKQKRATMVTRDVMLLHINRLRSVLTERSHELHGLEHRKAMLSLTLEERMAEVRAHHDALIAEARLAEEERRRVALEVQERATSVKHLKARFRVTVDRFRTSDQDGDGEVSHAEFVVRTAREKDELQARGDELDSDIKRLEKEARKLERAAEMMKLCNRKMKGTLKRADADDEEAQAKAELQERQQQLQALVNRRTADMHRFLRQQVAKVAELQELTQQKQEDENRLQIMRTGLAALEREVAEFHQAMGRHNQLIEKLRRRIPAEYVADIELRDRRDALEHTALQLVRLSVAAADPSYHAIVTRLFGQYGIELPRERPSSARSIRSADLASVASSASRGSMGTR
eukprot:TRINITY_DN45321_c0_g1_i1.p1 TRINITY_DN45321_c0_g1~~TRINITY_DN45321_c0_g1_i1.p1  ORF type:complete len:900 (+),score=227.79 TRINITY_DN45321_c0_g1_i1:90-2789(+)